jgi:hypothetical protein
MAVLAFVTPLLLLTVAAVEPASDQDLLRQAETAFEEGRQKQPPAARADFGRSAAAYEELRQRGIHNPDLYGNQGNAYLLADDLPRAILAYRRGLHLRPNDTRLQRNLTYAREQVIYAAPGRFARPLIRQRPPWLPRLTTPWSIGFALLVYALGWAAVSRWLMKRQEGFLYSAAGGFVATALLAVGFLLEAQAERDELRHPLVVVARDGVPLYRGNGTSYPHHEQPLNRGVEARLRFDKGAWLQIELASGEVGWVPRGDVLVDN